MKKNHNNCSLCDTIIENKSRQGLKLTLLNEDDIHICSGCLKKLIKFIMMEDLVDLDRISDYLKDVGYYDDFQNELTFDFDTKDSSFSKVRHKHKSNIGSFMPIDVKSFLDKHIVEQTTAKEIVSVAMYYYAKKIKNNAHDIKHNNILFVGPTGCGKTLMAETLSKILDLPFVMEDANALTQAGYVGKNVEDCIKKMFDKNLQKELINEYDEDEVHKLKGIIYIDEIDKIAEDAGATSKSVGNAAVQEALLKMIEGTEMDISVGNSPMHNKTYTVDTSNILFIFSGAFSGLNSIIKKDLNYKSMGFNVEVEEKEEINEDFIYENIKPKHLISYGMIPEIVGRIEVIAPFHSLSKKMLKRILTEPSDSIIGNYKKLFALDDVLLTFDDKSLDMIVERSNEESGARGLRSALEVMMRKMVFDLPNLNTFSEILITANEDEEKFDYEFILEEVLKPKEKNLER